ncbi:hypothetical protein CCACVL1_26312 [Corchorus capsularis]|uniref:RPW8 domain-containing protein n=1 Tax=Corchorus capsularis TaxID=210143 RepID=A0A1R3GF79_COCAP|nr:hypothetical protein CCACVL1_26312 [Corchorus capsularis]
MAMELFLGTAIQELLNVIEREREADFRFESILRNLKSILDIAFPRISQICELRKSNGLSNDQLHKLVEQMKEAEDVLDKFSRVACWNYCEKHKYKKELRRLNDSIRDFFSITMQIEQYENTSRIQVQLKGLAQRLDRLITRRRNASLSEQESERNSLLTKK